jgi:glycosidase
VDAGKGLQVAAMMVLMGSLPGKPLLYNGQEMGLLRVDSSPDAEVRRRSPLWSFYRSLLRLYQSHSALSEGSFSCIDSDCEKVYAFSQQHGQDKVLVMVNLSDRPQPVTVRNASLAGEYRDLFRSRALSSAQCPTGILHRGTTGFT